MKNLVVLPTVLALLLAQGCVASDVKELRRVDGVVTPTTPAESHGRLVVLTDPLPFEDDTFLYERHRPYTILDTRGALVRKVRNHVGVFDESPSEVRLPEGRYHLRVPVDGSGYLELAVEIEAGALTTVEASSDRLEELERYRD